MSGWIGVDLDRTIAKHWEGDYHPTKIGEPVPLMVERVRQWLAQGIEVRIFTARMSDPEWQADVLRAIGDWTEEVVGTRLKATCRKDYAMIEFWDDRARQVIPDTGVLVGPAS